MDTTSKTRKARKFGSLAAGVVLCLGIVNMPSAFADGATMTTNPAAGWVQSGEAALSISGTGCLDADNNVGGAVWVSDTSDIEDGWTTVTDHPEFDVQLDPDTGDWSALLASTDGTVLDLSDTTSGGLATIYAWCIDTDNKVIFEYDPVDVAVTGIGQISGTTDQDVSVEADGFTPGETVTFTLSGGAAGINLPVGTAKADENGHVDATINVPSTVERDKYDLTVSDESGRTYVTTLTVGTEEETTDNTTDNTNKMPDLGAGVA